MLLHRPDPVTIPGTDTKKEVPFQNCTNSQNGARTHDTAVNSRALYQLSYPGKTLGTGFEPATDRLTADCSTC